MGKYTRELIKCTECYRTNNFLVEVVEKKQVHYYLTKCPKCGSYEEVKKLTPEAAKLHKPRKPSKKD